MATLCEVVALQAFEAGCTAFSHPIHEHDDDYPIKVRYITGKGYMVVRDYDADELRGYCIQALFDLFHIEVLEDAQLGAVVKRIDNLVEEAMG